MRNRFFTPLVILTLVLLAVGLYMSFIWAPTERNMGDVQRIFYFHLGSFWTSAVALVMNALACIMYIIRRTGSAKEKADFWDALAASSAEIGVIFCAGGLIFGTIWAKPVWGIWWTWDARLTLTFLTWLMYIAYILLRGFLEGSDRGGIISAVFGIFAVVNVPMVYMANRWYRTMHPQPVIGGAAGSGMDGNMWLTVFVAWAATLALMGVYLMLRMPLERGRREVESLRRRLRVEDAV
jgi:heme exporter protein C